VTTAKSPLISPKPIQGMCSRLNSGAALISKNQYPTEGEFEFKISPSLSEGVVTAIGIADDD
jgi:hypothetical protein